MSRTPLSRRLCEVLGVAFFGLALLWVISLASYSASDPVVFFSTAAGRPGNFGGRAGALLAELAFQVLGFGAYLLPPALVVVGWHYFWVRALTAPWTKLAGAVVLFSATGALLAIGFGTLTVGGKAIPAGGALGAAVARLLTDQFNRTGALVLVLTALFLALLMVTQLSFGAVAAAIGGFVRHAVTERVAAIGAWREERRREKQRQDVIRKHLEKGTSPETVEKAVTKADAARAADGKRPALAITPATKTPVPAKAGAAAASLDADDHGDNLPKAPVKVATPPMAPSVTPQPAPKPRDAARISAPALPLSDAEPMKAPAERRKGDYTLPPLALLDAARAERKVDERLLMDAARHLEDKCREFAVEGSVVQIHPGPVVTTFELKPDAGVKYSKITGLSDDLSLAMKAESVLIDRIPGKSTVGIQIPNADREQISLREMLESEAYQNAQSKLMMALGKSIHGEPFFADLATMPHLLIAGSTGTGKSVGLNSMLTSILYRATPDDVRLIMIDPKRLELGMYADIPHLLTPVVVDPKLAANALKWAVGEMEHRYKTMASEHVRNIEQYNRNMRIKIQGNEMLDNGEPPRTLPFIVVVIDELADLMMVAGHEVEESICRLAQMARAVGIHLILATQRPSVDVITGLIKANLPARISFRVSSKIDSRTILDANGAEQAARQGRHALPAAVVAPAPPPARRLHLRAGERAPRQLPAQAGAADLRRVDHRRGEVGHLDRIRPRRALRRGVAHRRHEPAGLDLVPAAAAARRLQPRRPARRHDGGRRPRLERRRRQGARRAGAGDVLRRGGQPLGQPGGDFMS